MKKLLAFAWLSTTGCASLTVEVQILNPACLPTREVLEAKVRLQERRVRGLQAADAHNQLRLEIKKAGREYIRKAVQAGLADQANEAGFRRKLDDFVDGEVANAQSAHSQGLVRAMKAPTVKESEQTIALLKDALASFGEGDHTLQALVVAVHDAPGIAADDAQKRGTLARLRLDLERDVATTYASLIGGREILEDPLAPLVSGASDECWRAFYNRVYGSGCFGNTDIAIKMESAGNFTLKGIRLDGSKVAQAGFQLVKKLIQVASAAYGIPVPLPQGAAQKSGDERSVETELADAERDRREAEESAQTSRLYALALLEAVVAQRAAIADDGRRKAAITGLKQTVEAYRPVLEPEERK